MNFFAKTYFSVEYKYSFNSAYEIKIHKFKHQNLCSMKIFSVPQIRNADQFTIEHEPVSSLNLMERAAKSCADFLSSQFRKNEIFYIFCGNGNNGGDGFAISRLLYLKGHEVIVFYDLKGENFSENNKINRKSVKKISGIGFFDFEEVSNYKLKENGVIVDCIFGSGLNRKIAGTFGELIQFLNKINLPKISIDIPSGLFADQIFEDDSIIFKADETLTFQLWKRTFLHPETGDFSGKIHVLDIGLSQDFIEDESTDYFVIDQQIISKIYEPRSDFSNKGTYGKSLIVAGSFGKIGAAVLATKAALHSGSGITVTHAPNCGYQILQTSCPEAMFIKCGEVFCEEISAEKDFTLGIGPGLGMDPKTESAFLKFLKGYKKPLILDADALNILAKNPEHLKFIPKNSIITPHPKEFERLFGKTEDSFKRLDLARKKAAELRIYIVLKDHHTQIITPENEVYYNITGNSGMAKGGSGDVLLGMITSLLAQNYSPENASILGVWLHGKAGDLAAEKFSKEAMLPSNLIDELGTVFKILDQKKSFQN